MSTPAAPGPRSARRGPRAAGDARRDILDAARRLFAEHGYAGTSLRAVAREAGVDPGLVHHYFEGKGQLFTLTMGVDVDPAAVVEIILSHPREDVPAAIVATALAVWEDQVGRQRLLGILGSLTTQPQTAHAFGEFVIDQVLTPIARGLGVDQPRRRAVLVASQIAGLAMARFVLRLQPLAGAERPQVIADLAPTLRRYLFEPLPGIDSSAPAEDISSGDE